MIKFTSILSDRDWKNLGGNEVYVAMLRNKVKIDIHKGTKVATNSDDFRIKSSIKDEKPYKMFDMVLDYLNEVPEDLVYYSIEDVYGHKTIYVYFHSPIDKENFYHYYNMQSGIEEVTK